MKNELLLRARKASGFLLSVLLLFINYSEPVSAIRNLSGDVYVKSGLNYSLNLSGAFTASANDEALEVSILSSETLRDADDSAVTINLFGVIPVKSVNVHVRDEITLVPGGSSIGVTLHTRGALVVGVSGVTKADDTVVSPAASAGIQAGDLIEKANGIEIIDAAHLAEICNESADGVALTVMRDSERFTATVHPIVDPSDGQYRMGMWVRDSTAGVGTLSFYEPSSNWYGALGHAITDVDTRSNLTVREGEIVESRIVDIVQGTQGEPGELRGTFSEASNPLGTIDRNGQFGIFGRMYNGYQNALYEDGVILAYPEEAHTGNAEILTTLNDGGIQAYECNIIKVNPQSSPAQKGMILEVTDPDLLDATGGIVQGMSGSPVLQDGKLIGVVTHVFINDPSKGYCMYAYWMQQQIKK